MNDFSWIAPTVAAICSALVAIVAAIISKDNGKKVEEVKVKVEEIHATTNGTLTAANAATTAAISLKDVLTERVDGLMREIEELKRSSSLAAHVAEQAATDVRVAQSIIPPVANGDPDCPE